MSVLTTVIPYLALAFNLWMIVDAIRRRAEFYWLVILVLFAPIGSIIYFLVVKARDYDFRTLSRRPDAPASAPPLVGLARERPSADRLRYADQLERAERYDEALPVYESVLAREPDNLGALHGAARCDLGQDRPAAAAERLERVMELDSSFRDYSAALDYAEALSQAGNPGDAVELLEGLVNVSARLNHLIALAHYQTLAGKRAAARDTLERALHDYHAASRFEQSRSRRWADRAQTMLQTLGTD